MATEEVYRPSPPDCFERWKWSKSELAFLHDCWERVAKAKGWHSQEIEEMPPDEAIVAKMTLIGLDTLVADANRLYFDASLSDDLDEKARSLDIEGTLLGVIAERAGVLADYPLDEDKFWREDGTLTCLKAFLPGVRRGITEVLRASFGGQRRLIHAMVRALDPKGDWLPPQFEDGDDEDATPASKIPRPEEMNLERLDTDVDVDWTDEYDTFREPDRLGDADNLTKLASWIRGDSPWLGADWGY